MVEIRGVDQFVSYSEAGYSDLYFTVEYNGFITHRDIYTLSEQLSIHKLSLQHDLIPLHLSQSKREDIDQVAPVPLRLSRFSTMMVGDMWYSKPFFAFTGGYRVCLKAVSVKDCLISSELFFDGRST